LIEIRKILFENGFLYTKLNKFTFAVTNFIKFKEYIFCFLGKGIPEFNKKKVVKIFLQVEFT